MTRTYVEPNQGFVSSPTSEQTWERRSELTWKRLRLTGCTSYEFYELTANVMGLNTNVSGTRITLDTERTRERRSELSRSDESSPNENGMSYIEYSHLMNHEG